MKASSMKYLAGEGVRNIGANRFMSLASIGVLTACLLLIGAAWLVALNANSIVGYVEDQNEAMAFVEDWADANDILEIEEALKEIDNIHEVIYVSKAQALEQQAVIRRLSSSRSRVSSTAAMLTGSVSVGAKA